MHFALRKIGVVVMAGCLFFFCCCEKHDVGEMPEVQSEQPDFANRFERPLIAPEQTSTPPSAPPKPTPAEFFPKSTPR
jgi:hypothetical protein